MPDQLLMRVADLLDSIGSSAEGVSVPLIEPRYLYPDGHVERRRAAQLMTAWDTLYRTLRAPLADVCYRQDSRLTNISVVGGQVTVTFADGYIATADLLVGADGVNSTCRQLLNNEISAGYSGYVAWRGLEDESDLPAELVAQLADRFTLFAGDGMQFLCYLVPGADGATAEGRRRVNWVWYVNTPEHDLTRILHGRSGRDFLSLLPPGEVTAEVYDHLVRLAKKALPQLFVEVLEASHVFLQPVQDVERSRMVFDRALLIGDAAGTVRPHTAQGTSKAFGDAILLTRALDGWKAGDALPADRLAAWEERRLRHIAQLKRLGLRSAAGSKLGTVGAPIPWARA
jgi:2-polyprenyl-6-methoxyphenol hydroxylase-like FAD-dependent oxidoreductase